MLSIPILPNLEYENKAWAQGFNCVVGVDEVGRGALAGPILAAAVSFKKNHQPIKDVNDSKLLSAGAREQLAALIKQESLFGLGIAQVSDINKLGVVSATALAMKSAIANISNQVDLALIDGRPMELQLPCKTAYIVKGDRMSYSIASASIIAKVYRDSLLTKLSLKHPEYHWHQNKGYGTKAHRQAIINYGICSHHRLKFVSKLL